MIYEGERGPSGCTCRASIVIPFHTPQWIERAVDSCLQQTVLPQILLVPNGGIENDLSLRERLTALGCDWMPCPQTGNVGFLKKFGCSHAGGEWLIELDHDDLLAPNAVERILQESEKHPDAVMIFSDCHYRDWKQPWSPLYGWEYYEEADRRVNRSPEPYPQNLCRIFYGPDHVRAWRADWYHAVDGHDARLAVADDHDLTCRAWMHGPAAIYHIPECLYEYQTHADQTSIVRNGEVQSAQWAVYDRHVERLALEWSRRQKALSLDLGGGLFPREGYIAVDRKRAAIRADLDQDWPFGDESCGVIRMADVAEHLRNPLHTMNEAWRCLRHGGFLFMRVPSTDGRAAFRDPTHVSFWNIESFWYYTKRAQRQFVEPECKARFQVLRVHDIKVDGILYTEAHLIALHDGPRFHGLVEC
jgi:O-antigen biosynthesis protein